MPSISRVFFYLFLVCSCGMFFALYLQYHQHLEPCPLCIFQRIALIGAGTISGLASLHSRRYRGYRIYAFLLSVTALTGAGVAGRQIWLQHLPADQIPDCGPGLNYMLDVFPVHKIISLVLRGSGECAKIDWTLLGFSLPEYSFVVFIGIFLVAFWQILRR